MAKYHGSVCNRANGGYEVFYLLGFISVESGVSQSVFEKNMSPPHSRMIFNRLNVIMTEVFMFAITFNHLLL